MSAGDGSHGTLDSISSRDVEECLRMLEEVWPGTDDQAAGMPQQFGRFSIVRELGRGGFGVVFLAEDPLLERWVALKVPRVEVFSQSQGWRRFLREARTASRLDHPNLVPLLEAGTIGPVGYIVSAFVEGPTLEQCLRDARGGAPARFSARLVATLAGAIEHMHDRGILHRDLKPANILMQAPESGGEHATRQAWDEGRAQDWVPRICDFGLATLREIDGDETRTRLGAGSPSYMAPEQAEARNDDIGPATDIYGLGATLYELLTGRPPFTGASELETLRRVVSDEPTKPRQLRRDLPRDLETICLKCLAKRPEQRYASAAALAEDLERFLEGRPILARPAPAWERGWKWARRHPAAAALATATTLAVLAGLGGLIWHESLLRQVNEQLSGANEQLRGVNEQLRVAVEEKDRSAALLTRQLAGHQIFAAQQAVAAKNFELAHRQLEAAERELGNPLTRGFACSHIRRSFRDRLQLLAGHSECGICLTAAPDGRALASSDAYGEIRVWDLETGRSVQLAPRSNRSTRWLVFSPDSRTLASAECNTGEMLLWDVSSGRLKGQLAHTGSAAVSSLFFTPDGRHLAASRYDADPASKLYVWWDVSSVSGSVSNLGRPVFSHTAPDDPARKTFTAVDERIRILADVIDGGPVGALSELEQSWIRHPPRGLSLTRDRRLAVIGLGDGTFTVQRFATDCWSLLIGRIQSWGTSIVLIDPTKWHDSHNPIERERERLERLATFLVPASLRQRKDSDPVVLTRMGEPVAYSNDGRMLAVWREEEDQLNIIDLTTGREAYAYNQGEINNVRSMCFTPDGTTLAMGGADHVIRLWHIQTEQQPVMLPGHAPKEAWALAFAPDGRTLASGGDDHQVRLWNTATGREKAMLTGHQSLVTSLAFTPESARWPAAVSM